MRGKIVMDMKVRLLASSKMLEPWALALYTCVVC